MDSLMRVFGLLSALLVIFFALKIMPGGRLKPLGNLGRILAMAVCVFILLALLRSLLA